MTAITVGDEAVRITLSRAEKVLGLMGDQVIPLASVTDVGVEPRPLRATSGLRAPGTALPGVVKIGTWRRRGRRQFVAVHSSRPALRLVTSGLRFDSYLVSAEDAEGLAAQVSLRLDRR